jgi:fatty-acyl-CoA synthase
MALSKFTETMYGTAESSSKGLVTGEPNRPVRHTWGQVHERARRIAGGLATAGVGLGDAVPVLAGAPVEIAPAGQGVWMRGRQHHHPPPAQSAHRSSALRANTTRLTKPKSTP